MEEKLSLKTSLYNPKRFNRINCQKQIGLTLTNLNKTHFILFILTFIFRGGRIFKFISMEERIMGAIKCISLCI